MNRRPSLRFTVEALEQRLTLSASPSTPHAQGSPPLSVDPTNPLSGKGSRPAAAVLSFLPYSHLTVGGKFQAGAPTTVTFADSRRQSISVTPTSVTATSVSVTIPFFQDTRSGQPIATVASVVIKQGTGRAAHQVGNKGLLTIANLPRTGLPAGNLVAALALEAEGAIQASYKNVASTVPTGPNASLQPGPNNLQVEADLTALEQGLAGLQAAITPPTGTSSGALTLGKFQGRPATVNTATLDLLDRGIAAVLDDPTGDQPFSAPLQGTDLLTQLNSLSSGATTGRLTGVPFATDRILDVLSTAAGSKRIPAGALASGLALGYVSTIVAATAGEVGTAFNNSNPNFVLSGLAYRSQSASFVGVGELLANPTLQAGLSEFTGGFTPATPTGRSLQADVAVATDLARQINPYLPNTYGSQLLADLPTLDFYLSKPGLRNFPIGQE